MGPRPRAPFAASTRAGPSLGPLARALALAASGPAVLAFEAADAVTYLAWLAILAPAVGYLAAVQGLGLFPYGLSVPGVWMVVLAAVDGRHRVHLPTPFWAALAVAGLFALGASAGGAARHRLDPGGPFGAGPWGAGWAGAGVLLLAATLAAGLPGRGGAGGGPLGVAAARALLDLSPATLVVESAGVDWMRDPAVYDPVATDRFQRRPYDGKLAGPLVLLVGCLAAALSRALTRARERPATPSP